MNRRMRMKPDITRVRVSLKPALPTENEVSLGRSDEENEWLNTWESDLGAYKQDKSPIEIEVNEGLSEIIREWNEYYLILIQMIIYLEMNLPN